MKQLLLSVLKLLFSPSRKELPQENVLIQQLENTPKILIIRQHNQLGDMLLSTSLFRAIKKKLPESYVSLIANKDNYCAVTSNKYIDNLIILEKKKFWNPIELIRFIIDLKKQNFDLVIVPVTVSISFTSCILARLSGAKYSIGPATLDSKINKYSFLFNYRINVGSENDKRHISDKILDIVRPFGIETDDLSEHILITNDNLKFAKELFKDHKKFKIGLHIGAGKVPNRWDIKKFAEVINYISKNYDAMIYLTVGPWEESILDQIMPLLHNEPFVIRNLEIPKLAAVIQTSDLFISNDTGIMHVAGSTNTPLISIFGPTDPEIWAPKGNNKFFIKKGEDINSVDVKDVLDLVNKILI